MLINHRTRPLRFRPGSQSVALLNSLRFRWPIECEGDVSASAVAYAEKETSACRGDPHRDHQGPLPSEGEQGRSEPHRQAAPGGTVCLVQAPTRISPYLFLDAIYPKINYGQRHPNR